VAIKTCRSCREQKLMLATENTCMACKARQAEKRRTKLKRKARRSVWTTSGGLPGLSKKR